MREILILSNPVFGLSRTRIVTRTGSDGRSESSSLERLDLASGRDLLDLLSLLTYFQSFEDFGDILAYKLLSMALITFFSLLLFSGILTSLSKLYLSKDLGLVHAMPVSRSKIFLARWIESTWIVLGWFSCIAFPFFCPTAWFTRKGAPTMPSWESISCRSA